MKFFIVVCALVACALAGPARDKRSFLGGLHSADVHSLGYGDFGHFSAPILGLGHSAPVLGLGLGHSAHAADVVTVNKVVNSHHVVDVPQVVNVRKVVSVPQVVSVNKVVAAPSYIYDSGLHSGYGSGWSSGLSHGW